MACEPSESVIVAGESAAAMHGGRFARIAYTDNEDSPCTFVDTVYWKASNLRPGLTKAMICELPFTEAFACPADRQKE